MTGRTLETRSPRARLLRASGVLILLALFHGQGGIHAVAPLAAQDPPLPSGLGGGEDTPPDAPSLPAGLGGEAATDEPALPVGLGGDASADDEPEGEDDGEPWITFLPRGFVEARFGTWLHTNGDQRDASIGEQRAQVGLEALADGWTARLTVDVVSDPVADDDSIDLERGTGFLDLREASIAFTPTDAVDVRIGRQVLTWGTGDLVFINDLFPKDYNSFFLGRDVEYLKAPSDALRVAAYHDVVNVDLVYTPSFDADRSIDGSRVSYYAPSLDAVVGRSAIVASDRPSSWFDDDEWALRLHRRFDATEVAFYGYVGRWKSPNGFDPASNRAIHARLAVTGASVRKPVGGGIGNVEVGYYDSLDDRDGDDPNIPNGQVRALVGFEREIGTDRTLGVQGYIEHRLDHSAYRSAFPSGQERGDRDRVVLTARLTQLLLAQNLELSLFAFVSPTDEDAYLRPRASYAIDDRWSVEVGGNIFWGRDHTFFGQFEESSNFYLAVRYGF